MLRIPSFRSKLGELSSVTRLITSQFEDAHRLLLDAVHDVAGCTAIHLAAAGVYSLILPTCQVHTHLHLLGTTFPITCSAVLPQNTSHSVDGVSDILHSLPPDLRAGLVSSLILNAIVQHQS
jgi:hypothetical protein